VLGAAQALEPHRITYYLGDVAGRFHSYYNAQRVLVDDAELAAARLVLIQAVGQVIRNGLGLLGVSAPEAM
jgi:arginyl-tRNA synthetase